MAGKKYIVLDISRDGTYGKKHEYGSVNHMQAMTVAPVDKKGKVDKSQITIAYAGTNPTDMTDLKTDAVYVAGFDRTITKYGHVGMWKDGLTDGNITDQIANRATFREKFGDNSIRSELDNTFDLLRDMKELYTW